MPPEDAKPWPYLGSGCKPVVLAVMFVHVIIAGSNIYRSPKYVSASSKSVRIWSNPILHQNRATTSISLAQTYGGELILGPWLIFTIHIVISAVHVELSVSRSKAERHPGRRRGAGDDGREAFPCERDSVVPKVVPRSHRENVSCQLGARTSGHIVLRMVKVLVNRGL